MDVRCKMCKRLSFVPAKFDGTRILTCGTPGCGLRLSHKCADCDAEILWNFVRCDACTRKMMGQRIDNEWAALAATAASELTLTLADRQFLRDILVSVE